MQAKKNEESETDSLQIRKAALGGWQTNCYVLVCSRTEESVIIDPGAGGAEVIKLAQNTSVKHILITHSHPDHIGALQQIKLATEAPVGIHPLDAAILPISPDFTLGEGQTIAFGHINLRVLHTPGHTPGSTCLLTSKHLFSGDTIFPGGPGATKTPADLQQILDSIAEKVLPLPDETVIHPGHGDSALLGQEREAISLFLRQPRDSGFCGDVTWHPS